MRERRSLADTKFKNMKTRITTIVLILLMGYVKAQSVGIGTATPDASTKLEIEDTQRGVLMPRVSLSNVNTFGLAGNTQTEGILVYNSNASITGGTGKGFYYWNSAKWVALKPANSNTTNSESLIYTTDGF